MKKRLLIIIPLLLIVIAGAVVYRYFTGFDDDLALMFSGNIEVTEAQMSFRIPGRLQERLVEEGDSVSIDQPLARLENTDQTIAVAQAEASLAHARAVLAELEAGSRQEEIARSEARVLQVRHRLSELQNGSRAEDIETARAELDRAVAAEESAIVLLNRAQNEYDRYNRLIKSNAVSKDNVDVVGFERSRRAGKIILLLWCHHIIKDYTIGIADFHMRHKIQCFEIPISVAVIFECKIHKICISCTTNPCCVKISFAKNLWIVFIHVSTSVGFSKFNNKRCISILSKPLHFYLIIV